MPSISFLNSSEKISVHSLTHPAFSVLFADSGDCMEPWAVPSLLKYIIPYARVAHGNGCLTGAETTTSSVGEPAHHPLDQIGFYGFGQHLKPAICEKYHNPKNSRNACTGAASADDCGVMSLGHSQFRRFCDVVVIQIFSEFPTPGSCRVYYSM